MLFSFEGDGLAQDRGGSQSIIACMKLRPTFLKPNQASAHKTQIGTSMRAEYYTCFVC